MQPRHRRETYCKNNVNVMYNIVMSFFSFQPVAPSHISDWQIGILLQETNLLWVYTKRANAHLHAIIASICCSSRHEVGSRCNAYSAFCFRAERLLTVQLYLLSSWETDELWMLREELFRVLRSLHCPNFVHFSVFCMPHPFLSKNAW